MSRLVVWRLGHLLPAFRLAAVDALALGLDDLLKLLVDLVEHPAQVVAAQHLLAALAQAIGQVAQAEHPLLVAALEALLHQPAQGAAQVAVGQQVLGEGLHDGLGVERQDLLAAVPVTVGEELGHNLGAFYLQCLPQPGDTIGVEC